MRPAKDKWINYRLLKDSPLAEVLPDTGLLSRDTLWTFLDKYGAVVLKPCDGSFGYGVISVSKLGKKRYRIHSENRKETAEDRRSLIAGVKSKTLPRKYIIQRQIRLAQINGRPFDFRVMAQRRPDSEWKVTGTYAKVAEKGYFVTNVAGAILPVSTAMERCGMSSLDVTPALERTALLAAMRLNRQYPELRMVGFDIGLDAGGGIWIIEANFKPLLFPFRMLKDKSAYRTIMAYME